MYRLCIQRRSTAHHLHCRDTSNGSADCNHMLQGVDFPPPELKRLGLQGSIDRHRQSRSRIWWLGLQELVQRWNSCKCLRMLCSGCKSRPCKTRNLHQWHELYQDRRPSSDSGSLYCSSNSTHPCKMQLQVAFQLLDQLSQMSYHSGARIKIMSLGIGRKHQFLRRNRALDPSLPF